MKAMKAKTSFKHPSFADMICKAVMDEQKGPDYHGTTMQSLKKAISHAQYELPEGWEKRMARSVKVMMDKKQLVHVSAAHTGHFRLSHAMVKKQERKRGPRKAKKPVEEGKKEAEVMQQDVKPAAAPVEEKKKAPVKKGRSPAKRAKQAHAKASKA